MIKKYEHLPMSLWHGGQKMKNPQKTSFVFRGQDLLLASVICADLMP